MSAASSALCSHKLRFTLGAGSAVGTLLFAAVVWGQTPATADSQRPTPVESKTPAPVVEFTADGKLKRPPVGYRKWVSLGTPFNHNDGDDEFHAVYMDPASFAHYEKTGQLRDNTVLVKELVGVGAREASSGKGYFMGEFKGLQVSIKDSTRFQDEPGNWAYFDFGTKYPLRAEASMKPAASCNKCHSDNAKTDWVFSQYYPNLRAAAPRSK